MALSITLLDSGAAGSGATSVVSNTITPAAGSLVLVCLSTRYNSSSNTTIAVTSTFSVDTWTRRARSAANAPGRSSELWYAIAADGSSGTVSFTISGLTYSGLVYGIFEITGFDSAAPVLQSATGSGNSFNLASAAQSGNLVVGVIADVVPTTAGITPGSGFTEAYDLTVASAVNGQAQYRTGYTGTLVNWSGTEGDPRCSGIEIAAAAGGGAISGEQTTAADALSTAVRGAESIGSPHQEAEQAASASVASALRGTPSLRTAETGAQPSPALVTGAALRGSAQASAAHAETQASAAAAAGTALRGSQATNLTSEAQPRAAGCTSAAVRGAVAVGVATAETQTQAAASTGEALRGTVSSEPIQALQPASATSVATALRGAVLRPSLQHAQPSSATAAGSALRGAVTRGAAHATTGPRAAEIAAVALRGGVTVHEAITSGQAGVAEAVMEALRGTVLVRGEAITTIELAAAARNAIALSASVRNAITLSADVRNAITITAEPRVT